MLYFYIPLIIMALCLIGTIIYLSVKIVKG